MWERVLERFLNSISDASFWVTIILVVGTVGFYIFRGVINHLSEDVDLGGKKEEQRRKWWIWLYIQSVLKTLLSKIKLLFNKKGK